MAKQGLPSAKSTPNIEIPLVQAILTLMPLTLIVQVKPMETAKQVVIFGQIPEKHSHFWLSIDQSSQKNFYR